MHRVLIAALLITLLSCLPSWAQPLEVQNHSAGIHRSWAVAVDDAGHVYWAPRVATAVFGHAVGLFKYDRDGNLLCEVANGPAPAEPHRPANANAVPATGLINPIGDDRPFIAIAASGFVYVAGAALSEFRVASEDWFIMRFYANDPDGNGPLKACDWDANWPDATHNAVVKNWDTTGINDSYDEIDGLAITENFIYASGYAAAEFGLGIRQSDIGIAKFRTADGSEVWSKQWDASGGFDSADGHLFLDRTGPDPTLWLVGRYNDCNMGSLCFGTHTKKGLITRIIDNQGTPRGSVEPRDPDPQRDIFLQDRVPQPDQYYGLAADERYIYAIGNTLTSPTTAYIDRFDRRRAVLQPEAEFTELRHANEFYQGRAGVVDPSRGLLWLALMRGTRGDDQDLTLVSIDTASMGVNGEYKIAKDNAPQAEDGIQEPRDIVRFGDTLIVAGDTHGADARGDDLPFLRFYRVDQGFFFDGFESARR